MAQLTAVYEELLPLVAATQSVATILSWTGPEDVVDRLVIHAVYVSRAGTLFPAFASSLSVGGKTFLCTRSEPQTPAGGRQKCQVDWTYIKVDGDT